MDKRKIDILDAIIDSYIDIPTPVGSRTISKDFNLGISSATIRNEMADLEDLGYLNKPHTSAGRIPSDKAYRFYVDHLQKKDLINYESEDGFNVLIKDVKSLDELFRNTARLLADVTNCTSFVISSKKPDTKIKFIELISLDSKTVLLLIVGNKGVVEKEIISLEKPISDEDLKIISENLNKEMMEIDFDKVSSLKVMLTGDMVYFRDFISEVIKRASSFNQKISEIKLYYDGLANILNYEEYWDVSKARELISYIENEDSILNMLNNMKYEENTDVEVLIGSENTDEIMKSNSIIRSTFRPEFSGIGQIGIIGPTRMDYKKHIKTVKTFSDNLAAAINKMVR